MDWFIGKARRKDKDPSPSQQEETKQYLHTAMLNCTTSESKLRDIVNLADGLDQNEWIASHTIAFFEHINLLYGTISEFCSMSGCPDMSGPCNRQYLWVDEKGKRTKLTAPQYVDYVMTYAQKAINDESIFPTKFDKEFPPTFLTTVKKIMKLLYHVVAHIYHSHFKEIVLLDLHPHLNCIFAHMVLFNERFKLIEDKEVEVLQDLAVALKVHPIVFMVKSTTATTTASVTSMTTTTTTSSSSPTTTASAAAIVQQQQTTNNNNNEAMMMDIIKQQQRDINNCHNNNDDLVITQQCRSISALDDYRSTFLNNNNTTNTTTTLATTTDGNIIVDDEDEDLNEDQKENQDTNNNNNNANLNNKNLELFSSSVNSPMLVDDDDDDNTNNNNHHQQNQAAAISPEPMMIEPMMSSENFNNKHHHHQFIKFDINKNHHYNQSLLRERSISANAVLLANSDPNKSSSTSSARRSNSDRTSTKSNSQSFYCTQTNTTINQ